jgi:hypothetical protein
LLLVIVPDPSAKRATITFEDVWAHAEDRCIPRSRSVLEAGTGAVAENVRINSHGMRGPDFATAKPAGVRRIVLLGDSVTFGYGVSEEECFATRLRLQLGSDVEVINAGITGYSSWQGLRFYETVVREYRPDVLLVLFGYNDHHSAVWSDRDKYRRRHAEAAARVAAHAATFRVLARLRARMAPATFDTSLSLASIWMHSETWFPHSLARRELPPSPSRCRFARRAVGRELRAGARSGNRSGVGATDRPRLPADGRPRMRRADALLLRGR